MVSKAIAQADLTVQDALFAIARHVRADGHADIRHWFDQNGNLLDPHSLSDDAAMRVAGFEVAKRNLTAGDDEGDTVIRVKLRNHSRYVEMAAKYFKPSHCVGCP